MTPGLAERLAARAAALAKRPSAPAPPRGRVTIYKMLVPRGALAHRLAKSPGWVYVGQTTRSIDVRLQDHIGEARRGKSASVLHVEMRRAIAAGLPIRIEPLQEVDEERAYQAEGEWAGYLDTLWPAGLNSPAPGMRARRHVDMLVVPVPSISPEHLLPCIRTLFADVQAHGNRDAAGALHCAGAPGAGDQ